MRAPSEGVGTRMHIHRSRFEWKLLISLAVILLAVIAFSPFFLTCSDDTEEYVSASPEDEGWDPDWPVEAGGYDKHGNCGDEGDILKWYYYKDEGKLIIAGHGKMKNYDWDHDPPWEDYLEKIRVVELSNFIERIGSDAFESSTVTEVRVTGKPHPSNVIVLPDNLKETGWRTFAFSDITGTVQLPEGMTHVDGFCACEGLTGSVVIPDSVTSIGDTAFTQCNFDGDLVISNNVTTIPGGAFQLNHFKGVLHLGDKITYIGDYAFRDAGNFTELKIGTEITYIGKYAFNGCKIEKGSLSLAKANYIGSQAFRNCQLGGTLTLRDDASGWKDLYIGDWAFAGCSGLVGDLTIPYGAEVENDAFNGCSGFDGTLTYNNRHSTAYSGVFKNCSGFKTVILAPNIHWIQPSAFQGCSGFSNEIDMSKFDSIQDYAFAGCTNLKGKVDVSQFYEPADRDYIGAHAFENCINIEEVWIHGNINEIREYAFAGCTGLKKITVEGEVKKIKNNAFENCTGLTVDGINIENKISIGDCAFQGCTGFNGKLVINGSWKIGANAFTGCTNVLIVKVKEKDGGSIDANAFGSHTFFDLGGQNQITPGSSDFYNKTFAGPVTSRMIQQPSDVNGHSISYDADGGSEEPPVSPIIAEGIEFTVQSYSGTIEGKTFDGWYYNGTTELYKPGDKIMMRASDIYFKAKWVDPPKYKITYKLDGGSGTAPTHQPAMEGEKFKLSSYDGTKDGYYYEGWKYNGNIYQPGTEMTMGTSEMVFMAAWSSKPVYEVVYNIDGGSGEAPATQRVKEGLTYTLASYSGTKENYLFRGWIYDGEVYEPGHEFTMGTKDVVILANWIPLHSVTYDLNGGTGEAPVQDKVAEGDTFTIKECTATKDGYWLDGWVCINVIYHAGDVVTMDTSDITLTANWKKGSPPHHVTYDTNGGSGEAPIQADVQEGSTFTIKYYSGTKDGYDFKGWSYGGKTYQLSDKVTMGKEDIVLKAVWETSVPDEDENNRMTIMIGVAIGLVVFGLMASILIIRRR